MSDIDRVIRQHEGPSRTVLEYGQTVEKLVKAAKAPGFGPDGWAPLAELVATHEFVRVGNFKEEMNWQEYTSFLGNWAASAEWDCSFKRVTEANGVVFLELEERSTVGNFHSVVNSMSVYEFSGDGRIRRIDVYLQMELPSSELLQGYDGVEIAT
ncbi:hypothetical protein [Mycolicibacterium arseniciresistens]|uniref:SnoaL-like domain-containing protein n=1 Tax=Mycolicibacterium arseniciresistens TaxID=3062257 RepID=A0ABT8UBG5_9MYCO|nr:hypothetical protein [Mycolicibacterium arseniciresistens]MDO3634155.1 hypothetical protein [Mycolicibacterium arseniciresistens]